MSQVMYGLVASLDCHLLTCPCIVWNINHTEASDLSVTVAAIQVAWWRLMLLHSIDSHVVTSSASNALLLLLMRAHFLE
jgi:hypothetical protein